MLSINCCEKEGHRCSSTSFIPSISSALDIRLDALDGTAQSDVSNDGRRYCVMIGNTISSRSLVLSSSLNRWVS